MAHPDYLDERQLERLSKWLPRHMRCAEIAYDKVGKRGRYEMAWREAFNRHAKLADMMQANIDKHYRLMEN